MAKETKKKTPPPGRLKELMELGELVKLRNVFVAARMHDEARDVKAFIDVIVREE